MKKDLNAENKKRDRDNKKGGKGGGKSGKGGKKGKGLKTGYQGTRSKAGGKASGKKR